MPLVPRPHPPALPHGSIEELLPGVFSVTGTVAISGPLTMRFSRRMTIVREGERLVLVNSVRLDEAGLTALDKLGKVTDVLRLAAFHGMDDPFYRERYGAKIWAVRGQRYIAGFAANSENVYFEPDEYMDRTTELPLAGAKLLVIDSTPPEANLLLAREGGVLVSGDSLQNWAGPDPFFNWPARLVMRMMGFFRPHNIGPAWRKQTKPPAEQLRALLDEPFDHVVPSHGAPVLGGARDKYRPALERL